MSEFTNSLPEDLRENKALAKFEDNGALAKSYLEMESRAGNSLRIYSDEMDDAQRAEVFGKIKKHYPNVLMMPDPDKAWGEQPDDFKSMFGIPEDKSGYETPADFKGLPDEILEGITLMASEAGLNRSQWKSVANWFANGNEMQQGSMLEATKTDEATVKAVLGLSFDESSKGIELMAKQFEDENHPIDLEDPLTKAALNNPAIKLMLNNIRKNAFSGPAGNGTLLAEGDKHQTVGELQDAWNDMQRSEENKLYMDSRLDKDRRIAHQTKRRNLRKQMMEAQ